MKTHFVVQKTAQISLFMLGITFIPVYNLYQLGKKETALNATAQPVLKNSITQVYLFGVDWEKEIKSLACDQSRTILLKGIFKKSSGEQSLILNIDNKTSLYQQSDFLFNQEKLFLVSGNKLLVKNQLTGMVSAYCLSEAVLHNPQKHLKLPISDFQLEIATAIKTPFFTLEALKENNELLGYKISCCTSVCSLKGIELKNNDVILKVNNQLPSKQVLLETLKKPEITVLLLRNNQKLYKTIKLPHWMIKKIHNERVQN